MHADRLLKLAALLEADAVNPHGIKFDLGLWGSSKEDIDDGVFPPPVSISCGTKACAMGLATLSGAFAQFGLHNGAVCEHTILPAIVNVGGWTSTGFNAAARLFDINYDEANDLFNETHYPGDQVVGHDGELMVASRIREFVADQQAGG